MATTGGAAGGGTSTTSGAGAGAGGGGTSTIGASTAGAFSGAGGGGTVISSEVATGAASGEILNLEIISDIAKVMDILRQMQGEIGKKPYEPRVPLLHTVFLDAIKRSGRIHEMSMLRTYLLKSGDVKEKLKPGSGRMMLFPLLILNPFLTQTFFLRACDKRKIKWSKNLAGNESIIWA
jgi:hypothetical protein